MPSSLRTALFSTGLSLSLGCSFFSIDNPGQIAPEKGASGKGGAAGNGGAVPMGGSGGSGASGGSGGDGAPVGTGGSSGSGTGGSATAGSGGSAGTGTMAGAGGASGGMPSMGGMGGDIAPAAGAGGTAGGSAAGMTGSAGGGTGMCTTLNPGAQAFGGHCYLLVTTPVNFDAAKNACTTLTGHLVTISLGDPASRPDFDAENAYVLQLGGGMDTWLGLSDGKMPTQPGDGTPYTWINGEKPDPPADAWDTGEPNNYNKPCMNGDSCYEHCGFMLASGKWNDDLCEATKQYVCEWDMGG
jgi:Lectin C-type domain